MKKKILALSFLAIVLNGCTFFSNSRGSIDPNGTWRLYDVRFADVNTSDRVDFSEEAKLKSLLETPHIISFFKDNSFTEIKGDGHYSNGSASFSKEEKIIDFRSNDRVSKTPFSLEKNEQGKSVLTLIDIKSNVAQKFIKECSSSEFVLDDPFYRENNTWRLKPNQKEDSALIAIRVKNYIKHLALLLKAAKINNLQVISFEFSKGPAKIYSGAIGIEPFEKVEQAWLNCFYDEKDCLKGHSILEHVLSLKRYKGASTGNWVEDDYNILLDLYSRFEK